MHLNFQHDGLGRLPEDTTPVVDSCAESSSPGSVQTLPSFHRLLRQGFEVGCCWPLSRPECQGPCASEVLIYWLSLGPTKVTAYLRLGMTPFLNCKPVVRERTPRTSVHITLDRGRAVGVSIADPSCGMLFLLVPKMLSPSFVCSLAEVRLFCRELRVLGIEIVPRLCFFPLRAVHSYKADYPQLLQPLHTTTLSPTL